jgi:hypothetical protein
VADVLIQLPYNFAQLTVGRALGSSNGSRSLHLDAASGEVGLHGVARRRAQRDTKIETASATW